MTPLTDAQIAAIAERDDDDRVTSALRDSWQRAAIASGDRRSLLRHSAALAAHLAEAEQTIERLIDAHRERQDLLTAMTQKVMEQSGQLATAQATIERLTTALREIQALKVGVRETCNCRICQARKIADAALDPKTTDEVSIPALALCPSDPFLARQ